MIALSVILYCLPVAVVWGTAARRDRAMWEFALDVPLAVALDLLAVLALARGMMLANAVIVGRGGWLAYGAARIVWRIRRGDAPRWPVSIDVHAMAATAAATAVSTWVSVRFSREFMIWDRSWHIPLVASLRGQRIPFANVYQPDTVLHYHFAGDVLAAQMQILSGCRLNASLGLSIAHDVMFGMTGLTFALLLQEFADCRISTVLGGALALLLSGPFTFWSDAHAFHGYSCLSYLQMSFRPHVCLAGLLIVGFVGALAVGGHPDAARGRTRASTLVPLLASGVALSLTDEASFALLGLSSGAVWLLRPNALHGKRIVGLAWLTVLVVGALAVNRAFAASVDAGGPAQKITFVPFILPGYSDPPRRLWERDSELLFLNDFLPTFATLVAIFWACGARIVRVPAGSIVFALTLTFAGMAGLTCVVVNLAPVEAHRFATAPTFVVPMLSMWILASAPLGALPTTLVKLALGAAAASTIAWASIELPKHGDRNAAYGSRDLYSVDCRTSTNARLGERATAQYVAEPVSYLWTGCHPTYLAGQYGGAWSLKTGAPVGGPAALRELGERVGAGPLTAACDRFDMVDPICQYALSHRLCATSGSAAWLCTLSLEDRLVLLGVR